MKFNLIRIKSPLKSGSGMYNILRIQTNAQNKTVESRKNIFFPNKVLNILLIEYIPQNKKYLPTFFSVIVQWKYKT